MFIRLEYGSTSTLSPQEANALKHYHQNNSQSSSDFGSEYFNRIQSKTSYEKRNKSTEISNKILLKLLRL